MARTEFPGSVDTKAARVDGRDTRLGWWTRALIVPLAIGAVVACGGETTPSMVDTGIADTGVTADADAGVDTEDTSVDVPGDGSEDTEDVAPDVEAPVVRFASPLDGENVDGASVSLEVTATDDRGVVSVEFFVDGESVGTDTSAPFDAEWDTTDVISGQYTLTAVARDAAGNEGQDAIRVSLAGACDGAESVSCEPDIAVADDFVLIPAGTFTMGSPSGELGRSSSETQHEVTLTRNFYMQATEVTQGQWAALMGNNPSHFHEYGDDHPLETVNWYEALAYANELSAHEGLPACYTLSDCSSSPGDDMECSSVTVTAAGGNPYDCAGYRLPTESEWEYAARAGTTTATYAGNLTALDCSDTTLLPIAWFCGNAGDQTHPVGGKTPNAWGLYDMLGNVREWTWDRYGSYPGTVVDPLGASSGPSRVRRGGSWEYLALYSRAGSRAYNDPGYRDNLLGFRLARTAP